MRISGKQIRELHTMKYWEILEVRNTEKTGRREFIFDFFLQRTLLCFLFVFAKCTITSLIYYMLVQDHYFDQSTPAFGFCFIPNCMRTFLLLANFATWESFLHMIFCKESKMSLRQLSMSGVLVTYVGACA